MVPVSIRIIRAEHVALAEMLRSLRTLIANGPDGAQSDPQEPQNFFDVVRAMLFYVDEFPERLHHPKESDLLFPRVARMAPDTLETIVQLERDHARSEADVRQLQHLLVAWELLGNSRRTDFMQAAHRYMDAYLKHMLLEETIILPAAMRVMNEADWEELDAAFSVNCDPLNGKAMSEPAYQQLIRRIARPTPASAFGPINVD